MRIQSYAACLAEAERDRIASNIKKALAAKKRKNLPVGNPATLQPFNDVRATQASAFAGKLQPTINAYRSMGMSQRAMVDAMNSAGIKTATGRQWGLIQLQRVLARLPA